MNDFFTTLFENKPSDHLILIWQKFPAGGPKESHWIQSAREAIEFTKHNATGVDMYVGCGLVPAEYVSSLGHHHQQRRCPSDKIGGIPGLWIDIDIADPSAHKKKNLPKDQADVDKILNGIKLPPSLAVDSGHGRQFWWCFDRPWMFAGAEDRERAQRLAHRFTFAVREHARKLGFEIDMTFDLARVFRIPGTMNMKSDPVPTRLLHCNGDRYTINQFDKLLPQVEAKPVPVASPSLILNPQAEPPFEKWEALMANEPKFKLSWDMARRDFKDSSPSSYDFSLASFAFLAGWSWQDACNLLIAFRRKHGLDLKLRMDYYQRTLSKTYNTIKREEAQEAIDDIQLNVAGAGSIPSDEKVHRLRESLSEIIGIPICKIIKYLMDPPEYRIETARGKITLGAVDNLIKYDKFKSKLAAATGVLLIAMKPAKWQSIAQAMLDACEEEDVGAEATDYGFIQNWLALYLVDKDDKIIRSDDDWNEAYKSQNPFIHNGRLYFFGPALREWLTMIKKEMLTSKEMGRQLRIFGCKGEQMTFRTGKGKGQVVTRSVWSLPASHELAQPYFE